MKANRGRAPYRMAKARVKDLVVEAERLVAIGGTGRAAVTFAARALAAIEALTEGHAERESKSVRSLRTRALAVALDRRLPDRGDDVTVTVRIPQSVRNLAATRVIRILRLSRGSVQVFGDPVAVGEPVDVPVGSVIVVRTQGVSDERSEAWAAVAIGDPSSPLVEIARARGPRRIEDLARAIEETEHAALMAAAPE